MEPKERLSQLVSCVAMGCWAAVVAAGAGPLSAQEPGPVVVQNVNVVDVDAGTVAQGQDVTVLSGRILNVEPSGSSPLPESTTILDGEGLYLAPGFVDAHVHVWNQSSLDLLLAHGVTTVRDMNGSPHELGLRVQITMGLRRGPRLVLATPILEGTPPPESADVIVTEGRIIVDDSATAADTVQWLVHQGYDAVKVYNNLNRSAYAGIVAAAAGLNVPVIGHVPLSVGLPGAFEARQSSVEHLRGYVLEAVPPDAPDQPDADYRSRLIAWRHADTTRLRELAKRTAQEGIWNAPTLGVLADLLPSSRIAEVTSRDGWKRCMRGRYADPIATRRRAPYFAVMTDDDFAATQEGVALQKLLVKMLTESGAGILVGTDRLPWGFAFHWELEELSDAGIDAASLLRAATAGAAEYLGLGAEIGSIEAGKRADFVLLEANPLLDIRNARRVRTVFSNGIAYGRSQLDSMIDAACEVLSG